MNCSKSNSWIFSGSHFENSPSILSGHYNLQTEQKIRQQAAILIQNIGEKLRVYVTFKLSSF